MVKDSYEDIASFADVMCWNADTWSYSNCVTDEEADIHEYVVTIVTYVAGLLSVIMLYSIAKNSARDSGNSGKALTSFGFFQIVFALFLIFSTNWPFGLGFFYAGAAAIYAGVSGNADSGYAASILNLVAFFQTLPTFSLVSPPTDQDGTPLPALIDRFIQTDCISYYSLSDANTDRVFERCNTQQYLQLLRVMVLLISITSGVITIVGYSLAGQRQSKTVSPY